MKPKISVIIPVYNSEKYLNECIDSILTQTFQNFEIIAINDGSIDSSGQILDDYAKKYDNIKVIHKENEGQGYARKVGLDLAQGDYILFIDNDDYYEKDALEKLYRNITVNRSDIAIMEIATFSFDSNIKSSPFWYKNITSFFPENTDFENFTFDCKSAKPLVFEHCFACWNKIYSKQFLNKYTDLYFPKNRQFEDTPFHVQIILRAKKISICTDRLYNYRMMHVGMTTLLLFKSNKCFDIFLLFEEIKSILIKEEQFEAHQVSFLAYVTTTLFHFCSTIDISFKKKYYLMAKNYLKTFSKSAIKELEPRFKEIYMKFSKTETSTEFYLLNENEILKKENESLKENLNLATNTISDLQKYASLLNASKDEILSSWSFRIGSAITKIIDSPVKLIKGK